MSEDYLAQLPTATWNPVRGVWATSQVNLLCGHSALWQEVWPTSGMTVNGQVFALPMQEHHTTDSESLSSPILRTPAASEAERGHQPEDKSRARGGQVTLSGQMMTYFATPNTMDSLPVREGEAYERVRNAGGRKNREATGNLREQVIYRLPTPNTMDHLPARTPEQKEANKGKGGYANVRETVINEIGTNWGKFEPAIKRWEETLGRPAPAPTKPDGKDGAHRLSSAFTEWMMGVPEGWITDCGLTRNEELKACGNGVVPQQAELALRVLLEGIALPRGGGASESSNANS